MKYIRGFLMAWGMFCWIPCPYKKWHQDGRRAQIAMMPLVGTCIGIIVCCLWWGLNTLAAGNFIAAGILTGGYFLMTGFIHLDGFMDCSDATLPRHASLEKRIDILKDSHSGAFGVICLVIMLLIFFSAIVEICQDFTIKKAAILVMIFTLSRIVAAMDVLTCKAMNTSQYAQEEQGSREIIPLFIILVLVVGGTELILSEGSLWALIGELYSNIVAVVVIAAGAVTGKLDRKMLGGMNGDIAGHMITTAEMFGLMAMALIV